MADDAYHTPILKVVATGIGTLLCATETWLITDHIASAEGWTSPLVAVIIIAVIGAAAALPFAEHAAKARQSAKAVGLVCFFLLMTTFSFSMSLERVGGRQDEESVNIHSENKNLSLAQDAFTTAKETAQKECNTGRGNKCREAEAEVKRTREALQKIPAQKEENGMAKRIHGVLPFLSIENIELYQPLLLPIGLQLGGFLMLALGLSPKEGAKSESTVKDILPRKKGKIARERKSKISATFRRKEKLLKAKERKSLEYGKIEESIPIKDKNSNIFLIPSHHSVMK